MQTFASQRWLLGALQAVLLLFFALPAIQSAARDNDQASLVTGAMQIAHEQIDPSHDNLYLFDKQYGTYYLLALALKILPALDPMKLSNALLVFFYGAGSIIALLAAERRGLARYVGLMMCLIPALTLYAPFFGTSQLSLAFLMLSYPFLTNRVGPKFYISLLLIAVATTMRGDAVFCIPAIYTATAARSTLWKVLIDLRAWLLIAAGALPLLIGRLIAATPSDVGAPHFFIPSYYAALMVFAIGIPWLASAAGFSACAVKAAFRHRRWITFYFVLAISLWWSLAYYSIQMYSARYFFPTFFSGFVLFSSRRGRLWFRLIRERDNRMVRISVTVLLVLSIAPWAIGIQMSSPRTARFSLQSPTAMPTSDGNIPMGAYAAFQARMIMLHEVVDHNQQTLLSARRVHYIPCPNGFVEIYNTGMATFLIQAAEEQGYRSRPLSGDAVASCSHAYIELRGLLRDETNTVLLLTHSIEWITPAEAERPILSVDTSEPANATTEAVRTLIEVGKRTDFAYAVIPAGGLPHSFSLGAGLSAIVFSDDRACLPREGVALAVPKSKAFWSKVAAVPYSRSISVCAHQSGAWLPAEMPQFLQSGR